MGGQRLYVLVLVAVLVSGAAAMLPLAVTGSDVLASSYRDGAVRDMTSNARLFALAASRLPGAKDNVAKRKALAELVKRARADTGVRYTVVSRDGAVLVDSDEDARRMENHLGRPEIVSALAGDTGVDIRESPTLGTEWIYVAVPLDEDGVVRAAASLGEVNDRLRQWWKRALAGFCGSLALLGILALFAARALSRPLEVAATGAERYAKGDFAYRLPVSGSAEMRKLSESMGQMAGDLDSRFKLINRQREEMRVVFENMSEGILAVDADGRVMLINRAAEHILRLDGAVPGEAVESVARNASLLELIRETTTTDDALEREIRVPAGANDETLVQAHTARIRENGRDIGVLAVLRDVTRLRRLEMIRRDFIANVSHELRTPVTAVQSCLETLKDDGFDDRDAATGFLDMALRNTHRMGTIIGNLLFLAGMESGTRKDAGKSVVTSVKPVLDEALSLCREDADSRSITFELSCADDLTALMNPQLVVHAVVNLVDNAVKYGPEGGTVGVAAKRLDDSVEISVSDHGPGIAPRYQPRVFERFYRIDDSSRIKKGTGLGLALVKHIALSQGGNITLESEIGAGSLFKLTLPCG